MDFEDMINALMNPGEEGVPETIYDDIRGAYSGVSERADSADAKIAELAEANESLLSEVASLKAKNYDLLMSVSSDNGETDVESADDADTADDDGGVEDLIQYDDDDDKE